MPSLIPTWLAYSYSRTLQANFALPARSCRVFSTHTHACNLLSTDGEWIALVDPQHGNGPFHVVIPSALLHQRKVNEIVTYANDFLHFTESRLDLRAAALWEPCLASIMISPTILSWLHERLSGVSSPLFTSTSSDSHTLPALATPVIERLWQGLQQGDKDKIGHAAQQLAGLGPGLTPAGDDFLVGLMAALTLQRTELAQNLSSADARAAIGNAATPRTTSLSARWLQCAARGEFGVAWHQLANALEKADQVSIEQAITRILATGATSGADALMGFGLGLTIRKFQI